MSSIRDYFFGFMRFGPAENRHAYDISFGTIGYSLILARAFREVGHAWVFGKIFKLYCKLFHSVVYTGDFCQFSSILSQCKASLS